MTLSTRSLAMQARAASERFNNCQLRMLDLSGNKISDIGAQHLAEAISNNNCQLRTLNLRLNNITEAGEQKARNLLSISQSKCELII